MRNTFRVIAPRWVEQCDSSIKTAVVVCAFLSLAACSKPLTVAPDRATANDNRVPAGTLQGSELTLHIKAQLATWYPEGDSGRGVPMQLFAEVGKAPQNPGPLIRVKSGTTLHVSVKNALSDSTLIVYGLRTRPSAQDDTIHIPAGATRDLSFEAGEPGTYFYWATSTHQSLADRHGIDSQLHGAFIVDSAGAPPPNDRVFVLGDWIGTGQDNNHNNAELKVINGLSWPHTERFAFTVGDTVRWRWVNPTESPHPMHLHGFYFDVTSQGDWHADTMYAASNHRRVVTEMPLTGQTFAMTWVPSEPGNWLLHCHVAYHTGLFISPVPVQFPRDPLTLDPMATMRGMVLGINVKAGTSTARRAEFVSGAREIRLVAQAAPKRFQGFFDEMAFVEQVGNVPPAADSVPTPSSLLVLKRNQPVRVTIVNKTRAPTGVHWHGIELPSYPDGVPGYSGVGGRTAPVIAPGDSFVAAFTPPRTGTFMYHAHSNEFLQVNLGLYGGLLVVDPGKYDPARERLIILGGDGPDARPGRINGRTKPDTMHMSVGETYRIRLIDILPDWTIRVAMTREDTIVHWKALAKDGADLPAHAQTMKSAAFITGPGQTMDFEYRPTSPGLMLFKMRPRSDTSWSRELPIRVR